MPIPELQQFRDLMADKAAAKQLVMAALGRARLAEHNGQDASADWAIVDEKGVNGIEGEKMAAAQALADATVAAHPELFSHLEQYVNPDGMEQLVKLTSLSRDAGMEDEATAITMFELARFDRQQIGVQTRGVVRLAGGN